jgi:hypothetical protein
MFFAFIHPPPGRQGVLCQRRYKAYFRWSHYQFKLQPGLVLPEETEACASVTSAFLQVKFKTSGACVDWVKCDI